jgi:hypothetical protein
VERALVSGGGTFEKMRFIYQNLRRNPLVTAEQEAQAARAYIAQLELRVAELETRLRSGRGRSW